MYLLKKGFFFSTLSTILKRISHLFEGNRRKIRLFDKKDRISYKKVGKKRQKRRILLLYEIPLYTKELVLNKLFFIFYTFININKLVLK